MTTYKLILFVCLFHPQKQAHPLRHKIFNVLHGILVPCKTYNEDGTANGGCGGGDGYFPAPLSPVDTNLVNNALQNPTACDPNNLDGDDSDDSCPTVSKDDDADID